MWYENPGVSICFTRACHIAIVVIADKKIEYYWNHEGWSINMAKSKVMVFPKRKAGKNLQMGHGRLRTGQSIFRRWKCPLNPLKVLKQFLFSVEFWIQAASEKNGIPSSTIFPQHILTASRGVLGMALRVELGELSTDARAWMKAFLCKVKVLKSEGEPTFPWTYQGRPTS